MPKGQQKPKTQNKPKLSVKDMLAKVRSLDKVKAIEADAVLSDAEKKQKIDACLVELRAVDLFGDRGALHALIGWHIDFALHNKPLIVVQDRDWDVDDREGMAVATGEPSEAQWGDLLFALTLGTIVVASLESAAGHLLAISP